MRSRGFIHIGAVPLALIAMVACGSKQPEFEVLGIKLDSATLDSVRQIHPTLDCDRFLRLGIRPLLPDYKVCSVDNVEVANIRSSLKIEVNKAGIVTAVTLHGEPYDGPFINWSKAMTEKYGPAAGEERGDPVWNGSNGKAILTKTRNGGAMLLFQGKRWQQDMETLNRNIEKGQKF